MPAGRRTWVGMPGGGRFAVPDACGTTPPFAVWRLAINGISPSGPCPRPGIRAGRPGSATLLVPGGFIHVFCGIAKRTAIMVARKQRRRDGRPSKQPVPPAYSQSISQCRKHRQHDFDWEHEYSSKHRHPEKFLLLVVLPVLVRDPVGSSSSRVGRAYSSAILWRTLPRHSLLDSVSTWS